MHNAQSGHYSKMENELLARELEVLNCSEAYLENTDRDKEDYAFQSNGHIDKAKDPSNRNIARRQSKQVEKTHSTFLNDNDFIPDENSNDSPLASSRMKNRSDSKKVIFYDNWKDSKKTITWEDTANTVEKEALDDNHIILNSISLRKSLLKAKPCSGDYSFFKYLCDRSYMLDQDWMLRDGYFQIMINSIHNGKKALQTIKGDTLTQVASPATSFSHPASLNKSKRKLILLDLDETLVRSENITKANKANNIKVEVDKAKSESYQVKLRPHLNYFLKTLSSTYDLVLYTAGISNYADVIAKIIDPDQKFFKKIVSRDSCIDLDNVYIKDLKKGLLDGANFDDVILIDNYIHSFALSLDQGIPIKPYYGDPNDQELLYLLDLLSHAPKYATLKEFIKDKCGFLEFYDFLIQNEPYFSVD